LEIAFLLFITAFIGFILFNQWRTSQATHALAGRPVPEAAAAQAQHPDGTLFFFHHPRCAPCRSMLPVIESLAAGHPGRVQIIDIGEHMDLARAFGIRATPTTLWVKAGHIEQAAVGNASRQRLEDLLSPP
jgi:thioredoxin-like negative regulator of GroEL